MGVIVRPLSALGSPPASLFFSDSFTRATGPLGNGWQAGTWAGIPVVTPVLLQSVTLATLGGGSNGMRWTNQPNANNSNTNFRGAACPSSVYFGLSGIAQFSQLTIKAETPVSVNESHGGPCIFCLNESGSGSCYYADIKLTTGTLQVNRVINNGIGAGSVIQIGLSAHVPVANDVIRISGSFDGSNTFLVLTVNGGAPENFTDNTAFRFHTGSPGVFCAGIPGGLVDGTFDIDDYSCGPGA